MSRFESLSHSIYETRRILRDRLGRTLRPNHEQLMLERRDAFPMKDVDVLEFLLHVHIEHCNDATVVSKKYNTYRLTHPGVPTFNKLKNEGWFRVVWGRITTIWHSYNLMLQQSETLRDALKVIFDSKCQDDKVLLFNDISSLPPKFQSIAQQFTEPKKNFNPLVTPFVIPSPDWVAARLWEMRPEDMDAPTALRWWVDRCQLIGQPQGAPSRWWSKHDASAWRRAAFDVLQDTNQGTVDWQQEKALIDAQLHIDWKRRDKKRRVSWDHMRTSDMPSELIERWEWISDPHRSHQRNTLELRGDTWVLLAMLCHDLISADLELDGPSTAGLLDLVVARPSLLVSFANELRQNSMLLADVLLHPSTVAWGCLLVADWNATSIGAWERRLQEAEHSESRERAFADAMAIATQHLRDGKGLATQIAGLLIWLHSQSLAGRNTNLSRQCKVTERMLAVVHSELLSLPAERLREVLGALSFSGSEGLGTPRFTAALDLAAFAGLTDALDADSAVAAYAASLRQDKVPYFSVGLTPPQAAALARAATRSTKHEEFLRPIDVKDSLGKAKNTDNEYIARDKIARCIRAHLRVLSRAIVAWEGNVPDDLVQALAVTIRSGSTSHEERGLVSAFAARFDAGLEASRAETPLAVDIMEAYKRVPETSRSALDKALLRIDEPLTLARFLQRAPSTIRERLSTRINELIHEDAAPIHSLTEMQARIEELLNAGATEAAASYIDAEKNLQTFGLVEGRAIARLRSTLRLALLQNQFETINQTTPPGDLLPSEVAYAKDTIDFYKALAELSNPNGNAETAESLFESLSNKNKNNAAYIINRFAAYLSVALNRDLFSKLDVTQIPVALRVMNEADTALKNALGFTSQDERIHDTNRALLLLAIGRNEEAYQVIKRNRTENESDRLTAYAAVALARMGRKDEADMTLTVGEAAYPNSEVLKEAREHLANGTPAHLRVLSVPTDDPVLAIQSALHRLKELDLGTQARVFSRDTMDDLLIDEIRSAAAGVTSLVPHLSNVELKEDNITAILRQILEPRVWLFGISVLDQSQGGYSQNGNAGERDITLRKQNYEISVLEAVICKSNPKTNTQINNLTSHFEKLLGYSECRVFFHIVYSYVNAPNDVLTTMKKIAETKAPEKFKHARTRDLPHEDSRPIGFVATYTAQNNNEKVIVCLVMDMKQQIQREAAATAGRTRAGKTA